MRDNDKLEEFRERLKGIAVAAVDAVDPEKAVKEGLRIRNGFVGVGPCAYPI